MQVRVQIMAMLTYMYMYGQYVRLCPLPLQL